MRALFLVLASALAIATYSPEVEAGVSSLSSTPVTVYGAKWCGACKSLEASLRDRKIAFEQVDVDENPSAFAKARSASGAGGAIPLTSVARSSNTVWIVGAAPDEVERALKD